MHALNRDPPVLLPNLIDGYIIRLPKLSPGTVPLGDEPVPEDNLKLIKCQCKSESPCSLLRFGFNKAN